MHPDSDGLDDLDYTISKDGSVWAEGTNKENVKPKKSKGSSNKKKVISKETNTIPKENKKKIVDLEGEHWPSEVISERSSAYILRRLKYDAVDVQNEIDELKDEIDEALDAGDESRFMELTHYLKTLLR